MSARLHVVWAVLREPYEARNRDRDIHSAIASGFAPRFRSSYRCMTLSFASPADGGSAGLRSAFAIRTRRAKSIARRIARDILNVDS